MAFYVKVKDKHKINEMIEHLVEKYEDEIKGYDIDRESYDIKKLPDHLKVDIRTVSRRGGSLTITLSPYVTKYLKLEPGDTLALIVDQNLDKVSIKKVIGFETS